MKAFEVTAEFRKDIGYETLYGDRIALSNLYGQLLWAGSYGKHQTLERKSVSGIRGQDLNKTTGNHKFQKFRLLASPQLLRMFENIQLMNSRLGNFHSSHFITEACVKQNKDIINQLNINIGISQIKECGVYVVNENLELTTSKISSFE